MKRNSNLRILLGGVPFGTNNIGDEAILSCIIEIIRELFPQTAITVATHDPTPTEKRFQVRTCPSFGHAPSSYRYQEMVETVKAQDVFIWAGATGLSDYPHVSLELLDLAQHLGKQTIIFCTGMNNELNPALYRTLPGRRRKLLNLLSLATLNHVDFVSWRNQSLDRAMRQRIGRSLRQTSLIIVRDVESKRVIKQIVPNLQVFVGADPGVLVRPASLVAIPLRPEIKSALRHFRHRIGICISSQRLVLNLNGLAKVFDDILAMDSLALFFLPMNPVTDTEIMSRMAAKMKYPKKAFLVTGLNDPEAIATLAGQMDVVVSSRLHLLILASISLVPMIGIARGSKFHNFLNQFGLAPVGTTETLNLDALHHEIIRFLSDERKRTFQNTAKLVRKHMLSRLDFARHKLHTVLQN